MRIVEELVEIWPNEVCDTYYTERSMGKCHIIESHESCHMISHGKSHNKYRKVVHKHCISSVENLIGTPSSSCQLRLGVGLSCLG